MAKSNEGHVKTIEYLAGAIPASKMTQIARTYLKMDIDLIDNLRAEAKGNNWRFNVDVLNQFMNNNNDNSLSSLEKRLSAAAQAGLIPEYSRVRGILGLPRDSQAERVKLTEDILFKLSLSLTEKEELVALAANGLRMTNEAIQYHLVNNPENVSNAALSLFRAWWKTQNNDVNAYHRLHQALESSNMEFYITRAF